MTVPANLFVDAPEVEDISMAQLSAEAEVWPEEIIQKFKERIPEAAAMNMMVKFQKQDPENGIATGGLILNSADKAAVVPIIIKDFMLYPLDVMIAAKKLLPLTPDYFAAIFGSQNEVFSRIEEFPTYGGLGRFEDANLWNAVYPPALGRYAYASSGQYPILEEIADTINGAEFKKFLMDNEKIAALFAKNGHSEIIKKLANLQPVNMNEFRQGVEKLIPKSIVMLRREGPNKYNLLSTSDEVFHPGIVTLSREDSMEHISTVSDCVNDDINEVDQNGEKFLRLPEGKDNVFLADTDKEIADNAEEYDHYSVRTKNGVNVEGVVIPSVIDFEQKPVALKVFIGKTHSTIQPEIWGVRLQNSRFKLDCQVPKIGQTGVFVYQPDKSHALCTIPVTVKTIINDGAIRLKVIDLMGAPFALQLENPGSSARLSRIAKLENRYEIPASMKWIPMEGFGEVSNSAEDYAMKTAAERTTNNPVTLINTGYGQFSMKGASKYASAMGWNQTNLDAYQAKFLLAGMGLGMKKMAQTLKVAHHVGHCTIHGLKFPPLSSEKIAAARPRAEAVVKIAHKFRRNLLKEASVLDNAQTVDAMLSLNFVNPDNITKFIGKIPQFKAAISSLASCLLAARLGLQEIPEQATSSAMTRLMEVTTGLEKLRATQTMGVKQ